MAGSFAHWGNDLYTGRRSYPIIQRKGLWFSIVGLFSVASILVLVFQGLNLGIDFRGGSEFTVSGVASTDEDIAIDTVAEVAPGEEPHVTQLGSDSVRVQVSQLDNEETGQLQDALAQAYGVDPSEVTSNFIGPTWGESVSMRALWGTVAFVIAAAIFMALYFRAWRMSVAALVAMLIDVLVSAGVYAVIGWEVTPSTIIGFLTILGFSLYDKMVVFDKVRENTADRDRAVPQHLRRAGQPRGEPDPGPVHQHLRGGAAAGRGHPLRRWRSSSGRARCTTSRSSLFVGIAVGTMSSIFLATPLDVALREREPKIAAHTKKVMDLRAGLVAEGADESVLAAAASGSAQLVPGHHQGHTAQPKRRR